MRKSYLGIGILTIIVGLLMLFAPEAWTKVVVIFIGASAIVNGLFNLFYVRKIISDSSYKKAVIIRGLFSLLVGLIAIILPLALVATVWTVMLYVLACYLIISSIIEIFVSIKLKASGINVRPYYGEILLSIILAIVLFIIPAKLGILILRIIGAALVVMGIGVLFWEFKNRKKLY